MEPGPRSLAPLLPPGRVCASHRIPLGACWLPCERDIILVTESNEGCKGLSPALGTEGAPSKCMAMICAVRDDLTEEATVSAVCRVWAGSGFP